jgi:glutathione S-transferase
VDITLYGMKISHPARAAQLMVEHKGIDAKIVNLPAASQQIAMRALGFRGGTVPGMKIGGRRVQGSREISRALDEAVPEPPLFPADPERRAAVEEAEAWGEAVYQPVPRRIFRWSIASNGAARERVLADFGTPAPPIASRLLLPVVHFYMRLENGGEETARADVAALPEHLDHVDELIAEGVIDGEALNAADFQIAPTTRVLLNFSQLRGLVEGRPAQAHAMRVVPRFGRETPVEIPADWLV